MKRFFWLVLSAALLALPLCVCGEPFNTAVLTNIAARYQVPKPPPGARLVLAYTKDRICLEQQSTSRDPGIYAPVFLLDETTNGAVILSGFNRVHLQAEPNRPLWRSFATNYVKPEFGGYAVSFNRLSAFICAVQAASIGHGSEAEQIWQSIESSKDWDYEEFDELPDEFNQLDQKNSSLLLASCVYFHLKKQISEEPSAWPQIHDELAKLLNEFPAIKNPERESLFRDLTITINAKPPATNSTEALLLDWSRRTATSGYDYLFDPEHEESAPATAILLRGADVVPDLIALLDDQRISTHRGLSLRSGHS